VKRATMKAEKPPSARQSRLGCRWKKLAAKTMNSSELMTTSPHRP
jgi:hypothetical protein